MLKFLKFAAISIVTIIFTGVVLFAVFRKTIPDSPAPVTAFASSDFIAGIGKSRKNFAAVRRDDFYPSLSISVVRKSELLWVETIGFSNLTSQTPATPQTLYPIGSISKPLTSAAIMKLADAGRIDLDRAIGAYAPNLPAHYHDVTLRQLLSHQAGVRHYGFAFTPPVFTENGLNKEFSTTEDSLSIFIDDPLLFEPDTSFQYSTFGYTLVSYVLEQVTGQSFLTLMDESVFQPLAMTQTTADRKNPRVQGRSKDYISALRRLGTIPSPPTNSNYKWAGGGFLSTPTELARFGDAMLSGSFLSGEAFDEMTTPRKMSNGELNPQQYGLGWRIGGMTYPRDTETLSPIIHHGGTASGSQCALLLAPDFDITVAVCGNAFTGGSGGLIQLAAGIARNFQDTIPPSAESATAENIAE